MHANSLVYSRELGSRAGKFACMPEMVAVHPHSSNQIQMNARNQAHSDLLTDNAGSTQSSRTYCLSSAKHFWCVEIATRILPLVL